MFDKLVYFLTIYFVVFDSAESSALYEQWLEIQQIKCIFKSISSPGSRNSDEYSSDQEVHVHHLFPVKEVGSVRDAMTIYSKCAMLFLAPCRADTADEYADITISNKEERKTVELQYFCAAITTHNILFTSINWKINTQHHVMLHFNNFKLSHNYWRCIKQKLIVSYQTHSQTYCGKLKDWKIATKSIQVDISFQSYQEILDKANFNILYYGDNNYEDLMTRITDKPTSWQSLPGMQWNFKFIRFHFISVNKLLSMRLKAVGLCKGFTMKCYDGPENTSPVVIPTNNVSKSSITFSSSNFHLLCDIKTPSQICKSSRLAYSSEKANIPPCHINVSLTQMKAKIKCMCVYDTLGKHLNNSNNDIVWLNVRTWYPPFPVDYFLLEKNACMYGALFVFSTEAGENIKELWSVCRIGYFNTAVYTDGLIIALIHFHTSKITPIDVTVNFHRDTYAFSPGHSYVKEDLPPTVHSQHYQHIHKLQFHQPTQHWAVLVHFTDIYFSQCILVKAFYIKNISRFLDYNQLHDQVALKFVYGQEARETRLSTVKCVEIDTSRCHLPGGWLLLFEEVSQRPKFAGLAENIVILSMPKIYLYVILYRTDFIRNWAFCHLTRQHSSSENDIYSIQMRVRHCYRADFYLEFVSSDRSKSLTFQLAGKQHTDWLWLAGFQNFNLFVHNVERIKNIECDSKDFYLPYGRAGLRVWKLLDPAGKNKLSQDHHRPKFRFYKFR